MTWKNPIPLIMGFFGYAKIPVAAVRLSMAQERFLEALVNQYKAKADPAAVELFTRYVEGQKTLTTFLRSGKLISG